MIRNIVCEGTIKEIIGEPKKVKKLNEVLGNINLTEEEERFLVWISTMDNWTVKNLLSVMEKYKNK